MKLLTGPLIFLALLTVAVAAETGAFEIKLKTIPDGADVYLLTSSSQGEGKFLGTSDTMLPIEPSFLDGRGSLDLKIHKDGYHEVVYNMKTLAMVDGAELPAGEPVRLPSKGGVISSKIVGSGVLLTLVMALGFRRFRSTADGGGDNVAVEDSQASMDPMIGTTICGYKVRNLVTKGGMGSLYIADSVETKGLEAAVKVVDLHGRDADMRERFFRELAVASKLHHPSVVRTWDYSMLEDRFLAIVMEWLPGAPLTQKMRGNVLHPKDCIKLLSPVFEGLEFLHKQGIAHRDIKPDNIFVLPNDDCKIIDFGLAKDTKQDSLTQTGMLLGTPRYMAPEVVKGGGGCTGAADQYALGLIIYEMVTGRAPFSADDGMQLLLQHMEKDPTLACKVNDKVPQRFADAIGRMIHRDPNERFASMRDALAVLRGAA